MNQSFIISFIRSRKY